MALNFSRRKDSSLLGHTEVTFDCSYPEGENPMNKFRVVASPSGVALRGDSPVFSGMADLEIFAKTLSDAWRDHMKLKPKIEISGGMP